MYCLYVLAKTFKKELSVHLLRLSLLKDTEEDHRSYSTLYREKTNGGFIKDEYYS